MLDEKDLKEIAHLMSVLIENEVTPKFDLLSEKIDLLQEKLVPAEAVDDIADRVDVLEGTARIHSKEIAKLKKAN